MTTTLKGGYNCYQDALAERINGILLKEYLIEKVKNGKVLKQDYQRGSQQL